MDQSVQTAAKSVVENVAAPLEAHSPITFRERVQQAAEDMAFRWLGRRAPGDGDCSERVGEALDQSAHYLDSRVTYGLSPMAVADAICQPGLRSPVWIGIALAARQAIPASRSG